MEYITLVLAHHRENTNARYLWEAPEYSGLEKGDLIVVETQYGDKEAIVDAVLEDTPDDEGILFALEVAKVPSIDALKRVKGKYKFKEMTYKHEKEEVEE